MNDASIVLLKPKVKIFLATMFLLVFLALIYGSIQIWQTSVWLQKHTHYVREERDPEWNAWMSRIDAHLNSQDQDSKLIRENQKLILEHVAKHEQFMLHNESR